MEELRQNNYFPGIPSAEQHPTHHDQEESTAYSAAAPLPFRIFLKTVKESKAQIFNYSDRSAWFRLILKELAASTLPDQPLIEQYLQHMYRHQCVVRTMYRTYTTIRDFLRYLQRPLRTITRADLEAYVEHEQDRGLKLSSVRLKLVTLRACLRFLIEQELVSPELLVRPLRIKLPEALPKAIDPADVRQLLSVIHKVRDRALVLLLLRTGMRIGEVLSTKPVEVQLQEQKILIYQAPKNSTGRVVYFSEDARCALEQWLAQRDAYREFLFYGHGNTRLTYSSARMLFIKYLRGAGLAHKGYTIHCLRHTFASELLNAGMRLECLQKLLGHTSIEVTRHYARLTDKTRAAEYFAAMQRIERGDIDGHY
jgi:integrase/recombinase XerD